VSCPTGAGKEEKDSGQDHDYAKHYSQAGSWDSGGHVDKSPSEAAAVGAITVQSWSLSMPAGGRTLELSLRLE
jgi:hypothetical protein